jgi:hypothetical protein
MQELKESFYARSWKFYYLNYCAIAVTAVLYSLSTQTLCLATWLSPGGRITALVLWAGPLSLPIMFALVRAKFHKYKIVWLSICAAGSLLMATIHVALGAPSDVLVVTALMFSLPLVVWAVIIQWLLKWKLKLLEAASP